MAKQKRARHNAAKDAVNWLNKEAGASTMALKNRRVALDYIRDSRRLVEACRAVLERSGGRLYDTDQQTGETFDTILRAAIAKAEGGAA